MSNIKTVIEILSEAKELVNQYLNSPENEHHRLKITANIQRDIDYLSLITGSGDMTPEKKLVVGPATTIGGQPLQVAKKVKAKDLEPEEEKVIALRAKVDRAYDEFLNYNNEDILQEFEEIVIRGVAKKAKMKVTKTEPEVITRGFIQQIKDEIEELNNQEMAKTLAEDEEANKLTEEIAATETVQEQADVKGDEVTKTEPEDNAVTETVIEQPAVEITTESPAPVVDVKTPETEKTEAKAKDVPADKKENKSKPSGKTAK